MNAALLLFCVPELFISHDSEGACYSILNVTLYYMLYEWSL